MTPPQSDFDIAFKRLVQTHQEKVRNTCYRFVNNPEDADDLAQDVFIQIYHSITDFREESKLSTWIYRIAVNKSLDFLRRNKRKKRFARLLSLNSPNGDHQELEITTDATAESEFERQERKRILETALEKLPENQKTAITLSKIDGFGNKEIADILNTSVSSVEGLIHRAKKNLHKRLSNYYKNQ